MNLKKQNVMASLALLGSITWSMTTSACPANTSTTTYVAKNIGGTALCIAVKTNGVDADVGLAANFDTSGNYTASSNWPFSSLTLAVKPTSPLACGGIEDEDCDDMKEADSHQSNTQTNIIAGNPVANAIVNPTLPPSGLVACKRKSLEGEYEDHEHEDTASYDLILVDSNTIVSLFTATNTTQPSAGGLWTIKSNALPAIVAPLNPNYILLKSVCNAQTSTFTASTTFQSEPTDFVPCNLKSKISAQRSTLRTIGKTSLTCSLPATQCQDPTSTESTESLAVNPSTGLIGLPPVREGSYTPLNYNCN